MFSVNFQNRQVVILKKSKFRDTPTHGRTKENLTFLYSIGCALLEKYGCTPKIEG